MSPVPEGNPFDDYKIIIRKLAGSLSLFSKWKYSVLPFLCSLKRFLLSSTHFFGRLPCWGQQSRGSSCSGTVVAAGAVSCLARAGRVGLLPQSISYGQLFLQNQPQTRNKLAWAGPSLFNQSGGGREQCLLFQFSWL